jgi:hypothetical protein
MTVVTLAIVQSSVVALTLRSQQERMPAELSCRQSRITSYFEKKDGLANLFEARRSRREVRQKYFRALLDYHLSLAVLESAVGKNLS